MGKSCTNLDVAAYESTRAAVAADPDTGAGAFRTVTTWQDGTQARTTARSFVLRTDEPVPLGWVTQAVRRGVDYRDLRIEVEGDYDLRGYLALDGTVRPGFTGISYVVHVDTDAPADVLEEIRAAAEATSPMFDNVRNATPVAGGWRNSALRKMPGVGCVPES